MEKIKVCSRFSFNTEKNFYTITSIVGFLIIWQLAVTFTELKALFPGPLEVAKAIIISLYKPIGKHTLQVHLLYTAKRLIAGLVMGSILGNFTGLAMGNSKTIKAIISPVFEVLRPIPAVAWIPLSILWFGIDEGSKYFIIGISTFVICTLNAYAGAEQTDPVLIGAAKMLGAKDSQIFSKIVLPSSLPQIFAGLQIAISTATNTVLAAEMIRSTEGAGWIIIKGMDLGNMTRILVGIVAISFFGVLLITLTSMFERRALKWNCRGR